MISSTPLLLLTILSCIICLSFLQLVNADAVDDLWNKYMQQADTSSQQAKSYESTITRRERNLDHWDVPTAAAYLGLHPETLQPLPKYASDVSSAQDTTTASNSLTSSSTTQTSQQLTDEYIGHDAAILFYAQWCRNCHAVAPSWDAIATHINAGSTSSNIVMALFDCEKNTQATQLCLSAGITAYPTIMFVGRSKIHDTDFVTKSILGKDKSAGPYGATTLDRTVKFQGNWQYADQILDWISIMKGISYWGGVTDSGPLRSVRNVLFGLLTGGKYNKNKGKNKGGGSLPVGVPPNFQPELRGIGSSSGGAGSYTVDTAASAQEVKALEMKLNATTEEKKLYEKAVSHSSQLLNGMLFPSSKNDTQEIHRDPFTILTKSDGWYSNATSLPNEDTPNDEHPSILRSCALELSIDYCTRITTRETNTYLEVLSAIPESDPFPSLEEIEKHLLDEVKKQEPYCGLIETCMVSNFEELEECRPEVCPFVNDAACTYLESCLDPTVQDEYGRALGLIKEGEKVMDQDFSVAGGTVDDKASDTKSKAGVGGWGVPV